MIPCYEAPNCGDRLNCGALCDYQLTDVNEEPLVCENGFYGTCHGNDPEYCNGVQSKCDPDISLEDLTCNMDSGFARNGSGGLLGCDVTSDGNCMEFDNKIDSIVDTDLACWINGGNDIIKSQCEDKIGNNENMCRAMEYFCDWDSSKGLCTIKQGNKDTPPFVKFNTKYNTKNSTLFLRKDCSGLDNSECISFPGLGEEDNERYYVSSARSSWDSTKETSTHPLARINCVHDNKTGEKVCISLPRCQVVGSTDDCGRINKKGGDNYGDSVYMCAKTEFSKTDGSETAMGIGYITWCRGTQDKTSFEIPQPRGQDLIDLDNGFIPTTRNNDTRGRCGNYNECESNGSEELWNECVFDESKGEYGVDYTTDSYKSMDANERSNILRTNGFCADDNNRGIMDVCESKLDYLGSINWGRVFAPNSETAACQHRYGWDHSCISGPNGEKMVENYACTWCPDLQCKVGNQEQVCSEVVIDPQNGLPSCHTNSSFGDIVNSNAPEDCGCYLPKSGLEDTTNDDVSVAEVAAISGLVASVVMFVVALL